MINVSDSLYVSKETLDSLRNVITSLQLDLQTVKISKDFFSSVLSTQTIIFSTIVFILLAFSWFISRREMKNFIKSEMEDIEKEIDLKINDKFSQYEVKIIGLEASIYRAFASLHEDNPIVSYRWWLRASDKFNRYGDPKMLRMCLNNTIEALKKLNYKYEIEGEMEEIENLLSPIDNTKYNIEISAINKEIKRIFEKTKFELKDI